MSLEESVKKMGKMAADFVKNDDIVGLGSGSAVAAFVNALGNRIKNEDLTVTGIPTSMQIELVAEKNEIILESPSKITEIDIVVDGADQIDQNYCMIKGGGGAHFREKIMIEASKKRIIVADESKYVNKITRSVPIEVTLFSKNSVEKSLKKMNGNPVVRTLNKGYPFFTQNGNLVLDTEFGTVEDPINLENELYRVPGIIANGIFSMKIHHFLKAKNDGTVEQINL